jgi:hypothetical protein
MKNPFAFDNFMHTYLKGNRSPMTNSLIYQCREGWYNITM